MRRSRVSHSKPAADACRAARAGRRTCCSADAPPSSRGRDPQDAKRPGSRAGVGARGWVMRLRLRFEPERCERGRARSRPHVCAERVLLGPRLAHARLPVELPVVSGTDDIVAVQLPFAEGPPMWLQTPEIAPNCPAWQVSAIRRARSIPADTGCRRAPGGAQSIQVFGLHRGLRVGGGGQCASGAGTTSASRGKRPPRLLDRGPETPPDGRRTARAPRRE